MKCKNFPTVGSDILYHVVHKKMLHKRTLSLVMKNQALNTHRVSPRKNLPGIRNALDGGI